MVADTLSQLVLVAVAFAGGTGSAKLIEVLVGARDRRRTELSPGQRIDRAETRTRIAIEWGHKNAVLAISLGAKDTQLPVLNLPDLYPEGG